MGQETVCNSVGLAFENAARNVTYADYVEYVRQINTDELYVSYNEADYLLKLYAVTASQYRQVQATVR
jgi:hypothetical protein